MYACFYMGRSSDWLCPVIALHLDPGSVASIPISSLGAVHVELGALSRGTSPPAHLHRLTFRDPSWHHVKAHVNPKVRSVSANCPLSAWLQQILKGRQFVRFELFEQAWSSIHWASELTTGALYSKEHGLTLCTFWRKLVCFAKFSTVFYIFRQQKMPSLCFWTFGWPWLLLAS